MPSRSAPPEAPRRIPPPRPRQDAPGADASSAIPSFGIHSKPDGLEPRGHGLGRCGRAQTLELAQDPYVLRVLARVGFHARADLVESVRPGRLAADRLRYSVSVRHLDEGRDLAFAKPAHRDRPGIRVRIE